MNYTTHFKTGKPVVAVGAPGSLMRQLATGELERVFSPGHQYHDRVFYDNKEGKYYDRGSDLYLSLDEAHAFGVR